MWYEVNVHEKNSAIRVTAGTGFALTAFAANSVLCRLALGNDTVDAASFTTIRLLSGALTLAVLAGLFSEKPAAGTRNGWAAPVMLFSYAIAFSFAYRSLSTGTGALILFGMVQATMIFWGLRSGERPPLSAWIGFTISIAGLVYLVSPGLAAPAPVGTALMSVAGISWGIYSLIGRGSVNPLADTTRNFIRAAPFAIAVSVVDLKDAQLSREGVLYAVLSGAVASGVGYSVWYAVLKNLSSTRAAMLQLAVPPLAAIGGVVFLAEDLSIRLLVSSALILGGIALATQSRDRPA